MFGGGKRKRQIAVALERIRGANQAFTAAIAFVAMAKGIIDPDFGSDRYLAILTGFAMAASSRSGLSEGWTFTEEILEEYFRQEGDGPEMVDRVIRISKTNMLWIQKAEWAVYDIEDGGDVAAQMLNLAEAYLE